MKMSSQEETQSHVNPLSYTYTSLHSQVSRFCCMPWMAVVPFFFFFFLHLSQKVLRISFALLHCTNWRKFRWLPVLMTIPTVLSQVPAYMLSPDRRDWRNYSPPEQQPIPPSHAEVQHGPCHYPPPFSRPWPGSHHENGETQRYAARQPIFRKGRKLKKNKFHDWQCVELMMHIRSVLFLILWSSLI